jgi:hypothetical protein
MTETGNNYLDFSNVVESHFPHDGRESQLRVEYGDFTPDLTLPSESGGTGVSLSGCNKENVGCGMRQQQFQQPVVTGSEPLLVSGMTVPELQQLVTLAVQRGGVVPGPQQSLDPERAGESILSLPHTEHSCL